jgi:hypothetical protein
MVRAEDYALYLLDSDVECYLSGLLWTTHMYARGRCPDWSYTYAGRPAMTAMALVQYLERRLRDHSEETSDTSGKFNASSVSSTSPTVLSSVPTKKSKSKSHKDKDSTGATDSLLPMFAKIESCTPHLKQNIHVPIAPHRYLVVCCLLFVRSCL